VEQIVSQGVITNGRKTSPIWRRIHWATKSGNQR